MWGEAKLAERRIPRAEDPPPVSHDTIWSARGVSPGPVGRSGSRCSATRPRRDTAQTSTAKRRPRSSRSASRPRRTGPSTSRTSRSSAPSRTICPSSSTALGDVRPDLAVIMIGANDVTELTKPAVAVPYLEDVVVKLRERGAEVVVGTCPDLGTIRPIAQPLRAYARRLSRKMARAQTVAVVRAGGRTVSLGDLLGPLFMDRREMFAADQFHPSAAGLLRGRAGACSPPRWTRSGCAPRRRRRARSRRAAPSRSRRQPRRRLRGRAARSRRATTNRSPSAPRTRRTGRGPGCAVAVPSPDPDRLEVAPSRRMTDAVIVSVARSPIGRAVKGSLATIRPDDLAAQMVRAALDQVPALDPHDVDDLMMGCGQPGGESGFNIGRVVAVNLGYDFMPGTTVNRYCSSSLQTSRMAFHAIKAGEGEVFISAGVETVSRFAKGNSDGWPDTHNRELRRRRAAHGEGRRVRLRPSGTTRARTRCCPTSTSRWARPPRIWLCTRTSAARTWTTSASARRTSPRQRSRTGSGTPTSSRSRSRTGRSCRRTTARAPASPTRASPV